MLYDTVRGVEHDVLAHSLGALREPTIPPYVGTRETGVVMGLLAPRGFNRLPSLLLRHHVHACI